MCTPELGRRNVPADAETDPRGRLARMHRLWRRGTRRREPLHFLQGLRLAPDGPGSLWRHIRGAVVRNVISPEEGAELQRLYRELDAASKRAAVVLATKGMASPEFAEADKATGAVWRRIREILGDAD